MAISESLLIDVKVRKDGSIKQATVNVSAFEETIVSLKRQMKLLVQSTNELSQENRSLAKTFEASNGSIKDSAKLYEDIAGSVLIASSAIEKLSSSILFLFNDRNRDMLINVLRILSSIAEMKGMKSASNNINKLRDSVIELDSVFDEYHINNIENLEKTANKLEEQVLIYKILMGTALVASVSAATLTIGVFLTAVGQTIAALDDFKYAVYRVRNIYFRLDDILRRPEGMQIIRNEIYKTIATYDLMARMVLAVFAKRFGKAMSEISDASLRAGKIVTNSILLGIAKSLTSAENTIKSFKSIYVDGITLIGTEVQKEFKKGFSFSAYIKSAIGEVRSEYASMLMNIQVANIGVVRSFEKWSASASQFAINFAKVMTATFLNASALGVAQLGIFEFFKYAPIFLRSFASTLALLYVQFKNGIDLSAYLSVSLRNLGLSFLNMSGLIINAILPIQWVIADVILGFTVGALLSLRKYFDILRFSFVILLKDTADLSKSFVDLAGAVGQLVAHVAKLGIKDLLGFFTKLGTIVSQISNKMLGSIVNMFISISGSLASSVSNTTQFFKNLYDNVLSMSSSFVSGLIKSFADIGNKSFAMFSTIGQNIGAFGSSVNNTFVNIMAKSVQEVFKNAEFLLKAGTLLANPLFLIGQAAINSESSLIKFAGTTAIVAAILMGGFSAAIIYSLGAIGSLTEKIGTALMDAMEAMEQKFTKAQATLSAFNFVVRGYGKTIGEDAVGSLEMWNDAIQKITSSTTFSTEEVAKATKILIAEGSALGLTAVQNLDLLNRSVDIATAQGRDLADVSVAVASGLMGQSQSVLSLGINLKEAHLEHSKFLITQNKLMDDLTESEKIQLRYNELMKQTAPIIGAATNELETISGATKKVDQLFNSLQIRLGSMGAVTGTFILIQQKLLSGLLQLPPAFYDLFGIMIDVAGVFLKISGVIIKYTVLATGLIFTYKALVWATTQNAIAQGILTTVMNILGRSVMVQTAAVTSLSVAWSNFLLIAKGGLVLIFKTIIGLVGQLTYGLIAFGAALLANPMTWIIAAVTAVLYNFLDAANDIRKELSFLRDAFDFTGSSFKELGDIFNSIINGIKIAWKILYSSSKLVLLGLIETILLVQIAVMKLKAIFASSKEEQDAYNLAVEELTSRLIETDQAVRKTVNSMGEAFGGMSLSAKAVGESIKEVAEQTQIYALRAKKLVDVIGEISQESIKIGILGTEFEKASEAVKLNKNELDKLSLAYVENGAKNKETLDEIKTKTEELYRSEFELQRLRNSTLEDFSQKSRQLEMDRLRASGNVVQAIKMEYEAQRQAIDAQVEGLKLTGALTDEQIKKINNLKLALSGAEKLAISAEQQKVNKGQLQAIDEIKKKNQDLQFQIETAKLGEIELIDKIHENNLRALEDSRQKAILEGTYTKELEEQLKLGAKLNKQKAEQDKSKVGKVDIIPKSTIDSLRASVGEGAANFAAGISDGLASFAGAAGAVMGAINAVLDFAQQLIDFIPNVLNKIANIFNSLTDLPLKILEGIQNVFASIGNFVRNFIPNIITAVEGILDAIVAFIFDIPQMVRDLLDKIPDMLIKLLNRLPEIVENLIIGLIVAIPEIINALVEFLILKAPEIGLKIVEVMVTKLPIAIANGLAKAIKKVFGNLVNSIGRIFGFNVPDEVKNLGKDIADGAKKAVRDISRETSQIFSVKNLEEAAKGLQENEKIQEALNRAKSFWQYLMDRLNALLMFFHDSWKQFVNTLQQVWNGIITALKMTFEMVKNIFNLIISGIKEAFNFAANIIRSILDPIILAIQNAFKLGSDSILKAFNALSNIGQNIWDGFKSAADKGLDFFSNIGNKIVEGLKKALDQLSPGNLIEKIFGSDGKGKKGTVENALGIDVPFVAFAEGGVVPGNAMVSGDSPLNDRILALLSPGEYVIPRSAMEQPGVRELVDAVAKGEYQPQKFFKAGPVKIGGYVGQRIEAARSGGVSGAIDQASDLGNKIEAGGAQAWTEIQNAPQNVLNELAKLDPAKLWKLVEEKVWSGVWSIITNSAPNFHTGGMVPAFANGGDVMATLQPGEFVMQRSAVQQNGLGLMNKINSGQSVASNETYNFDINLQIDASSQSLDENYVRNKLIPSIKTELKKSSLRGEFILSDRGLR